MKKNLSIFLIALLGVVTTYAQSSVTLTFVCQTTDNDYLQPDSIVIENLTRNWSETIYYPDTVYILNLETSVPNRTKDVDMHVMPNPFEGTTHVNILSATIESIRMIIIDMGGRVCAEFNGSLQEGGNLFSISLTTPQTYVLSVQTQSGIRNLKMQNVGRSGANRIVYEGETGGNMPMVQLKSSSNHPFQLGDEMRYQGYASSRVSFEVRKTPIANSQIALVFDTHGSSCDGIPTLQDCDGNIYNTVQFGNQCWMKENLRTTHYADGESIPLSSETNSFNIAYRYIPYGEGETGDVSIYGYLYNWKAVMRNSPSSNTNPSNIQGICPIGWHVPSVAEWDDLITYVQYVYDLCYSEEKTHNGKVLASNFGWGDFYWEDIETTCCVGQHQENNNTSGLSIVPSGAFFPNINFSYSLHGMAYLWSSTDSSDNKSYYYILRDCLLNDFVKKQELKSHGFSVRCLKNEYQPQVNATPTVETGMPNNIMTNSANCSGNVISDGGATVTSRGICWSTSPDPTISDNHTIDGTGTGSFLGHLTGLSENTTYYVRAYAFNSVGVAYGNNVSFTTLAVTTPVVITHEVTNVDVSSVVSGGNVISDGGAEVSARGLCWGTTPNPSLADNSVTVGSGTGSFTYNITGLTPNTTYFVRAYATNNAGTAYGEDVIFTTLSPIIPTVATASAINITALTAFCGGNVTADGGAEVTARGVCWSTTPYPTITDSFSIDGDGAGVFTSHLTGMMANTTYYVRAYATNIVGTAYGNQISFTTVNANMPCSGTPVVIDVDGNTYNTIQVGNQCWMKENLRTTHYIDGDTIFKFYYATLPNQGHTDTVGLIYRLNSLMGKDNANNNNPSSVQSVCPVGWHLPSVAEFEQLFAFVKSHDGLLCNGDTNHIGWALGWSSSNVCQWTNNATGFSADYNRFRTCTQTSGFNYVSFDDNGSVQTHAGSDEVAGSLNAVVRCVRNEGVSLSTIMNSVTTTTTSIQSIITNTGTDTILTHGVCWSISPFPIINGNNVVYGNTVTTAITTIDTILITGLSFGQHYYIRAFANTNNGVIYGNDILVHLSCHGDNPLIDYDNIVYHSIQIGNQCWMKENLRSKHYSDGSEISSGLYSSPWFSGTNLVTYLGYLYSWDAVMNTSSSSSIIPSGVQGICPSGWHVPSDGEWTILTDYVSSQNQYLCNNNSTSIAKALASELYWNLDHTSNCTVGTLQSTPNNSTGFSARPVSYLDGGTYIGNHAQFWSTSKDNNELVWTRHIGCSSEYVNRLSVNSGGRYSVRCIKN